MHGELSLANAALAWNRRYDDENFMNALCTLRHIECNSHIKRLEIYQHHSCEDKLDAVLFEYLGQYCRDVKEVSIDTESAEVMRLLMNDCLTSHRSNGRIP
jgi:hypothetical protein